MVLPCLWGLWSLDSPHKPCHCSVSKPGNPGRRHKALFALPEFRPGRPSRPGGDGKLGPKERSQSSPQSGARGPGLQHSVPGASWRGLAGGPQGILPSLGPTALGRGPFLTLAHPHSSTPPHLHTSTPPHLHTSTPAHPHTSTPAVAPPGLSYYLGCQAGASPGARGREVPPHCREGRLPQRPPWVDGLSLSPSGPGPCSNLASVPCPSGPDQGHPD